MWVGLIQLAEGLNRTKGLTLPQVRKNSSCPTAFEVGHQLFPAFEGNHHISLGVEPAALEPTTPLVLLFLQPSDSDWVWFIVTRLLTADLGTCQPL